MLCISKSLNSQLISLSKDTESVYCKITQKGNKPIIVGCTYRPPDNQLDYAQLVSQELLELKSKFKNSIFLLGGDFNLPDIDWGTESIVGNQYPKAINTTFMDTFKDLGLTQVVKTPTRGENVLDLFLTSNDNLIVGQSVDAGIGDHDFVTVQTSLKLPRKKPPRRTIHLWNRADLDKLRDEAKEFNNNFISNYKNENNIDTLWICIKNKLLSLMNKYVPTKLSSTKSHQPWITSATKRILRKKQRWYIKAKKS